MSKFRLNTKPVIEFNKPLFDDIYPIDQSYLIPKLFNFESVYEVTTPRSDIDEYEGYIGMRGVLFHTDAISHNKTLMIPITPTRCVVVQFSNDSVKYINKL